MIARISGKLIEVALTDIVVDVNGVGYHLFIPMSTYDKLPKAKENVSLFTILNVREDALELYGFATEDERELFEILISVSGIGTKTALNILSSMPISIFCNAITNSEVKIINKISGIGRKTAERMILELKDKVLKVSPEAKFSKEIPDDSVQAFEDALMALEQLGFKTESSRKLLKKLSEEIPEKECSSENLIRTALQKLNK